MLKQLEKEWIQVASKFRYWTFYDIRVVYNLFFHVIEMRDRRSRKKFLRTKN
jgi:hypothetical protein